MAEDRVMVFIDGSNFYHGLKKAFSKTKVNFLELGLLLASGRRLEKVFYYTAPVRQEMGLQNFIEQRRFLERVRLTPQLEIRLGRHEKRWFEVEISCRRCGEEYNWRSPEFVQKGVDVYLAVDLIRFAFEDLYDVGVVVSADGDFAKAVEVARSLNRRIENIAFRNFKSYHLIQKCDSFQYLDDIVTSKVFLNGLMP